MKERKSQCLCKSLYNWGIKAICLIVTMSQSGPEESRGVIHRHSSKVHEYVYKKVHCEFMNKLWELRPISLKWPSWHF